MEIKVKETTTKILYIPTEFQDMMKFLANEICKGDLDDFNEICEAVVQEDKWVPGNENFQLRYVEV